MCGACKAGQHPVGFAAAATCHAATAEQLSCMNSRRLSAYQDGFVPGSGRRAPEASLEECKATTCCSCDCAPRHRYRWMDVKCRVLLPPSLVVRQPAAPGLQQACNIRSCPRSILGACAGAAAQRPLRPGRRRCHGSPARPPAPNTFSIQQPSHCCTDSLVLGSVWKRTAGAQARAVSERCRCPFATRARVIPGSGED